MKSVFKGKKSHGQSLKDIEESLESNTGFDPEDPPLSIPSETGKRPWESNIETDHRR